MRASYKPEPKLLFSYGIDNRWGSFRRHLVRASRFGSSCSVHSEVRDSIFSILSWVSRPHLHLSSHIGSGVPAYICLLGLVTSLASSILLGSCAPAHISSRFVRQSSAFHLSPPSPPWVLEEANHLRVVDPHLHS